MSPTPNIGLREMNPSGNFSLVDYNYNQGIIDKETKRRVGAVPVFNPRITGNAFITPSGNGKALSGTGSNLQVWAGRVQFEAQIALKAFSMSATGTYEIGTIAPQYRAGQSIQWHSMSGTRNTWLRGEGYISSAGAIILSSLFGTRLYPINVTDGALITISASYTLPNPA